MFVYSQPQHQTNFYLLDLNEIGRKANESKTGLAYDKRAVQGQDIPGYPGMSWDIWGDPKLSWDIPGPRISWDILGYALISGDMPGYELDAFHSVALVS